MLWRLSEQLNNHEHTSSVDGMQYVGKSTSEVIFSKLLNVESNFTQLQCHGSDPIQFLVYKLDETSNI